MPSHAKRVHLWKDSTPIFAKLGVEKQLESIYSPIVHLKSGGYIVINQAEALVAIDVNSGRATRERNIEQTAFKTNLEAADEAARQMRLRDLAGLIVIDFIDMEESKNDRIVEKRMKDSLRFDRARVQMGKISGFGLLELSRQRRRTGVLEGTSHVCEHCQGSGRVRSVESASLALLRALDEAAAKKKNRLIEARTASDTAIYLLNEKRDALAVIEENNHVRVRIGASEAMHSGDFEIIVLDGGFEEEEDAAVEAAPTRGRKQQRRDVEIEAEEADALAAAADGSVDEDEEADTRDELDEAAEDESEATPGAAANGDADSDDRKRRRRRGRRGGKRRREEGEDGELEVRAEEKSETPKPAAAREERGGRSRRRRRGRGRGRRVYEVDGGEWLDFVSADLKHLTPRPERPARNGDARRVEAVADDAIETAPPAPQEAEIIVHPAAEPVVETHREAVTSVMEAEPAPVSTAPDAPAYEPDQERRDKFFSRLSRWSKKN